MYTLSFHSRIEIKLKQFESKVGPTLELHSVKQNSKLESILLFCYNEIHLHCTAMYYNVLLRSPAWQLHSGRNPDLNSGCSLETGFGKFSLNACFGGWRFGQKIEIQRGEVEPNGGGGGE